MSYWALGQILLAGMDEAGRGCLAGPVVAACVIMPPDRLLQGVNDSKQISAKKRQRLYNEIIDVAVDYGIGVVFERDIEVLNILNASKKAFTVALKNMKTVPRYIFTDAIKLPAPFNNVSFIHGDARIYSIAAASILAKVARDSIMLKYDSLYPQYGFKQNKGYGTQEHCDAIIKYGRSPAHRSTFLRKLTGTDE